MTESRNDGMTDRLKTVYPPKTSFCGGYNEEGLIAILHYIVVRPYIPHKNEEGFIAPFIRGLTPLMEISTISMSKYS